MQDDKNMQTENKQEQPKAPNESGGVQVTGHIKITDPNTGEVILDKRGECYRVYHQRDGFRLTKFGKGKGGPGNGK